MCVGRLIVDTILRTAGIVSMTVSVCVWGRSVCKDDVQKERNLWIAGWARLCVG